MGNVEFPVWVDDETVIYAEIQDDGHHYIKSDLYIQNILETNKVHLTQNTEAIALYPTICEEQLKVAFNSPEGEVYLIKLIRE